MKFDLDISIATLSEFRAEQPGKPEALRIGADLFGTTPGEPSGRSFLSMQPLGLLARPRDPDSGPDGRPQNGANLLHGFIGNTAFAMPLSDSRFLGKVPPSKKGGVALYSAPGGILDFDGDNGALTVLVPYDATSGKNYAISIDPAGKCMQLRHAAGMGLAMFEGGTNPVVINNKAGNAQIIVDDTGIVFNGTTVFNGGMAMGEVETAQPVALAPAYLAVVEQIASLLHTIAAAVNGVAPGSVPPALLAALDVLLSELPTQGQSTKLSASP